MLAATKPLAKYLQLKQISIYDAVFTIHSKCTVVILLAFALLLSAKQYFGTPIQCMTELKYKDFMHSYCWTVGTFLVRRALNTYDDNSVAIGVGPQKMPKEEFTTESISLRYYQWVVIVLSLEALIFYMPSYLWKLWEGNRLKELCFPAVKYIVNENELQQYSRDLVAYFNGDNNFVHRFYIMKLTFCEFLNIFISVSNMLFLEYFFNGYWSKYFNAILTIPFTKWNLWNLSASQTFPKLAKCTIYTFGLGGSINNHDALCMLPLNILNEKIFAFLWLWYIFILVLATIKIVYHSLLLCLPCLRVQLLRIPFRSISSYQIKSVLKNKSYSDWFIMYKISRNVNPKYFENFLIDFHDQLVGKPYSPL